MDKADVLVKLQLWFFRDLTDAQRKPLFDLFRLPVATQAEQLHAFKHLLSSHYPARVQEEPTASSPALHETGSGDIVRELSTALTGLMASLVGEEFADDIPAVVNAKTVLARVQASALTSSPEREEGEVKPVAHREVTAEEHNAAFDPANDALGGAFKDGFREGWLFAKDTGFEDREELEEDYPREVDIAPSECWDAYRAHYFSMLPLAAIPEAGSPSPQSREAPTAPSPDELERLREAVEAVWKVSLVIESSVRRGDGPDQYRETVNALRLVKEARALTQHKAEEGR